MPETSAPRTQDTTGTLQQIDAYSLGDGRLQQAVALGDGATNGRLAHVGAGGDLYATLTSPNSAARSIFASLNPYGTQRVSAEPTVVFFDPFDGAVIDTNRWTVSGTQAPTQANGNLTLAPTVGASLANNALAVSVPTFASPGLGFTIFGTTVTLEAAQTNAVNVHRFWGKGQVTAFAYATPVTDGVGFEVDGATGALQCVVFAAGTKYVVNSSTAANISSSVPGAGGSGTALPTGAVGSNYGAALTWQGGQHRYAIMVRSDAIYWFVEGQEVPVAALSYATPNVQGLPVRIHSITNGAATSLANTFLVGAWAVNDSTAQNHTISDATYQFRRAQVGVSGGLAIKGAGVAGQTLNVAAATPVTGAAVAVGEAGNVTFVVKNTVAATAYTGNPVVVFEQSDDNVSWGPLAVTRADTLTVASVHTLPAGTASGSVMFDAALEGVSFIRSRVTTAPTANGMTIVTIPGTLAFMPNTVAVSPPQSSPLAVSTTAALSTLLTATLPAVAGQFHYITSIEIQRYAGAALTGTSAPVVVTTTNLPGSLAWSFDTAAAIGTSQIQLLQFAQPLKSSAAGTATTIAAPAFVNAIWRINVVYYTAP